VANEISKLELDDGIMVLPLPEGTTREIAEELSKRIKLVRENGMHAPFVHGITEQDGHLALMMDRPLGPSYTQWMSQSPYHWNKMISLLAHEAHEVHMHKLPELPSIKDLMWERIKMDSSLPDLTRRQVLGALKKMSDMDHVLNWNFIPNQWHCDGTRCAVDRTLQTWPAPSSFSAWQIRTCSRKIMVMNI
jgi:hypothetical protein